MAQNFVGCDREQELLLPPSLREWLPEGHLAWFVIDAVAQLDLSGFYAAYRADGHGRAAHDPAMMGALLLYAYAIGERSSQRIERRCVEDVACRVIAANQAPDHTTIARFRQRHKAALAELFGEVLALCAEAGLVNVGLLAIDGTKVHANASQHANRDYEQLAREILEEADAVDAPRTSGSATRVATSCRRSWPPARAGAGGCARPSAGSMTSAPRRPGRFRARDPSGCGNPSAAWRRSTRSNAAPTPITRPTGRAG
jgi:transposase